MMVVGRGEGGVHVSQKGLQPWRTYWETCPGCLAPWLAGPETGALGLLGSRSLLGPCSPMGVDPPGNPHPHSQASGAFQGWTEAEEDCQAAIL